MPNEQLVSYIRTALAQGIGRDDITRSLVAASWQTDDIDAAFSVVDGGSSATLVADGSSIATAPMVTSKKSFFSGRINRGTYLIGLLNMVLFLFATVIIFSLFLRVSIPLGILSNPPASVWLLVFILDVLILSLSLLSLSVTARRIHDMGLSGWYSFVPVVAIYLANYLAPYLGSVLALITFLFLSLKAGSKEMNAYGPSQAVGAWRGVWSKSPIPEGNFENRWIVPVALILYSISAVFSASQTYFLMQRFAPSPVRSSDATIQNNLATIQTEAEKYWGSHGNTYSVATSCNEGMFASDPVESTAFALLSAAVGTSTICAANGNDYVVAAPLSGGWWCVDSSATNDSGAIDSPPPAGSYTCREANASNTASTSTTGNQTALASERASFVKASIQSCVDTLGPSMTAAGVSNDAFLSFCSCVSNGVANRMTDTQFSELAALPNNAPEPSFYKEDLNSANEACKSSLQRK